MEYLAHSPTAGAREVPAVRESLETLEEREMSTRAQIKVKGCPVFIYKHCDGYPDGVLPTLEPFARYFLAERGNDPNYLTAQIVRKFAELAPNGYHEDTLGWGLGTALHGDEAFVYVIDGEARTLQVRTPTWSHRKNEPPTLERTRLEREISLREDPTP